MGGYKYKNVIECKDFEKGVPIEKIDALIGKMHDLPGIRAIIATRVKFQEGAKKKAEENNIDIIIVRNEDEQKDWTLPDGTPMIKQVDIELNIFLPIRITAFRPIFDMKWAREHNIEEFEINAPDSEILLINKETGVSETLYDYINTIPRNTTNEEHQSTYREDFNELYLCSNGRQIKVNALEFDYIAPSAEKRRIKIAPEVKGVIEYLNEKRKVIVLKNQDDRIKTVTIKPL